MLARKSIVFALSAAACAFDSIGLAAAFPSQGKCASVAFVNVGTPPLRGFSAVSEMLVQDLARSGASGMQMMASRRNLKKEKRARNEACARQYRKAPVSRFATGGKSGGPGRAAQHRDSDEVWLSQIYGQHSIFRRNEPGAPMASKDVADHDTKASKDSDDSSPTKELITA